MKIDRHKKILDLVKSNKRVSLLQLEDAIRSSRITLQRDLVDLENRDLLKRFHGGAMSLDYSKSFYDHTARKSVHIESKKKMAQKALGLVRPGSFIGLDSSSTVYYISELIFPADVSILACGIDTFNNLAGSGQINTTLSGGRLSRNSNTLVGPDTIEKIRKYHFDIVFISAESYIPGKGFFDCYEEEAQVKKELMNASAQTAVLLDPSKFTGNSGVKICNEDRIDYFITDLPVDKGLKKRFGKKLL
jgi:DeoR/GlpR family transcriptional regulator of sugar metabolism